MLNNGNMLMSYAKAGHALLSVFGSRRKGRQMKLHNMCTHPGYADHALA